MVQCPDTQTAANRIITPANRLPPFIYPHRLRCERQRDFAGPAPPPCRLEQRSRGFCSLPVCKQIPRRLIETHIMGRCRFIGDQIGLGHALTQTRKPRLCRQGLITTGRLGHSMIEATMPAPPKQNAPCGAFCFVYLCHRQACAIAEAIIDYSMIEATMPAPTVRPPSRMAKRSFSSIAIGTIRATSAEMLSPGITISVPSGSVTMPVTSVVRK